MNKQQEALKLALEALRDYRRSDDDRVSVAMGILQEALAERPAQEQSLQDLWHKVWPEAGAFVRASADDLTQFAKAVSTSPPASKPWVGLTEQERNDLEDYCEMIIGKAAFESIEAKLKEKNA